MWAWRQRAVFGTGKAIIRDFKGNWRTVKKHPPVKKKHPPVKKQLAGKCEIPAPSR